ncbi:MULTISPECIES: DUF2213 domain-containing protein [Klebsiella pneumoniae complex]|uniref:DUF2213 domain-containing protein n=1 Tax=Klebsiella pneumoniae complex TaxID=3390273 RepID=UPI0015DC7326|nr:MULTISPECIES: DUF2213 domain-containing protein [Klebsiella]BBR04682.1 hypothetical protein WP3S18C02_19520 [Klebsiella quasipneumoniae]
MPVHQKNGKWWWGEKGPYSTRKKAEAIEKTAYASGYVGDTSIRAMVFDKASRRRLDNNGYLHVSQTHLTKEQVAPYWGKEIPGWEKLGLEPEKVYYAYRSAEELEKAKDTFNGMPLLILHKQDSADAPLKELRVGSIGTTPVWDAPYLDNALTVTDKEAIDGILNESLKEISCGYFFEPDFTPGFFNGVAYDFVMRNIRGNHVALVKEGRAGRDVYVQDAMPSKPTKVHKTMQLNKKQVAAVVTLATYLKPRLAMDAAPGDLAKLAVKYSKPQSLVKAVVRQYSGKLAQDMEIEPEELAELMEAAEEVAGPETEARTEEEASFDEDNASESLKAMLEGKVPDDLLEKLLACLNPETAQDQETEEEKAARLAKEKEEKERLEKESKERAAMDANTIRQQITAEFKSKNEASRKVRELIGEVDPMAFDSANDIYAHALKQKGVTITQYEPAAYKGMVDMMVANKPAQTPSPAFDHSAVTLDGQFAGLKNIKIQ